VKDFGTSWRDGRAFLAIVHAIDPSLVDIGMLNPHGPWTNATRLETAFKIAERHLGVSHLIDPEDVDVAKPDEKSIMTYVAQFLHKYPDLGGSKTVTTKTMVSIENPLFWHRSSCLKLLFEFFLLV
jgi:nesprin-1